MGRVYLCLESCPCLGARDIARFLNKLTPDRRRDGFAIIHHAPRDRPLPRVFATDRDHLKLVGIWVVSSHNGVGRLVGPPLAEQPSPAQPGAADRLRGIPPLRTSNFGRPSPA